MRLKTIRHLPLAIVLTAGALACASAPAGGPSAREDRTQTITLESTQSGSGMVILRPDLSGVRESVELAPNKVWGSLPAAYNALPIPITGLDTANRSVSGSAVANRLFLRRAVSQFVDCGSSITGASADSYPVRFAVQTRVDSLAPSRAMITTRLDATASTSGGSKRCSSSGALENLIAKQVKELLGAER
jgi:hypothetical protein